MPVSDPVRRINQAGSIATSQPFRTCQAAMKRGDDDAAAESKSDSPSHQKCVALVSESKSARLIIVQSSAQSTNSCSSMRVFVQ